MTQAQHCESDGHAEGDFSDDDGHELQCGDGRRERDAARRSQREAQRDQRSRIVDETFTLQHGAEPQRQPHAAQHRQRCHGVRRRDDCAQYEAHRPAHTEQVVNSGRNASCRDEYATDGQQQDGSEIGAKAGPAQANTGRVKQRRKQYQQHQVRIDPKLGKPRNERHQATAYKHQDRRGVAQPAGRHAQSRDQHSQGHGDNQVRVKHAG